MNTQKYDYLIESTDSQPHTLADISKAEYKSGGRLKISFIDLNTLNEVDADLYKDTFTLNNKRIPANSVTFEEYHETQRHGYIDKLVGDGIENIGMILYMKLSPKQLVTQTM